MGIFQLTQKNTQNIIDHMCWRLTFEFSSVVFSSTEKTNTFSVSQNSGNPEMTH